MGKDTQKTTRRTRRGRDSGRGTGSGRRDLTSREFSSGGVVYRKVKGKGQKLKVLWLVTCSSPSDLFPDTFWRLPKGWIDNESRDVPGLMASGKIKVDEESLQKAALREVAEEGGIKARIIKKIETTFYVYTHPIKGKIMKFVTFYLMEYVGDLSEGHDEETSEVIWLPYEEAYKKLFFSSEKQVFKKAKELLQPSLV